MNATLKWTNGGTTRSPSSERSICWGERLTSTFSLPSYVTGYVRTDLDLAIQRFDSIGLAAAPELVSLLQVIRTTHANLAVALDLEPFSQVLAEVDERVSPTSAFRGRITEIIMRELILDLVPNFAFTHTTERFVRSPRGSGEPVARPSRPRHMQPNLLYGKPHFTRAFEEAHNLERGFVGSLHVDAVLQLLGPRRLPIVVDALVGDVERRLRNIAAPYLTAIANGLQETKLPKYSFSAGGVLHGV